MLKRDQMAWSFKRRVKVIPGIYLNFSKSGISTTIGVRGANINIGPNGTFLNTSISGTGMSNRQRLSPPLTEQPAVFENLSPPDETPEFNYGEDNIFTSDIGEVTSQDMQGIKEAIHLAHKQRTERLKDLELVKKDLAAYKLQLILSYVFLYGFIFRKYSGNLRTDVENQRKVIIAIQDQIANGYVKLDVGFDDELKENFDQLYSNYRELTTSKKIWDVTAQYANNRVITRSAASSTIVKREVKFRVGHLPEIKSEIPAMIWQNANGADLYFYPNFVIAWNNRESFAVIGIDEIDLKFDYTRFIEDQQVPSDTRIIDSTWEKVNKNGTPDRRFKDNRQLPIVKYGNIEIKTSTGLNERYMFSDYEATEAFARSFYEYQVSVIKLEYLPTLAL